jgi:hypothetical protein
MSKSKIRGEYYRREGLLKQGVLPKSTPFDPKTQQTKPRGQRMKIETVWSFKTDELALKRRSFIRKPPSWLK